MTGRSIGTLALAATLVLGGGAPGASAAEPPDPPNLLEVTVLPPADISYRWSTSGTKPVDGHRLNVYHDGAYENHFNWAARGRQSGTNSTVQFPDVFKPNTRYCVGLLAYEGTGRNDSSTFSQESERRCFTTPPREDSTAANPAPPPPTKPDLTVTRVSGAKEVFDGTTEVYEVALWNDGTPATDGKATVDIYAEAAPDATNPLEPVEMIMIPDGFTCELRERGQSGELGFACQGSLGGVDDAVQERGGVFRAQFRATGTGTADVVGSANHRRVLDEMDTGNDKKTLTVKVK